jgi:hypothetical protein
LAYLAPIAVKILPIFLREIATESGSEVHEKPNTSAPKTKKTPAFRLVLLMTFAKVLNFGKGFSKLY